MFQEICDRFRGGPKPLVIIFHLINFITSILLYRIIKIEDFMKRRKILSLIVYSPLRWFSKTFDRDIFLYNNKWDYFFTLSDTSSYGIMMLSHEGNVPLIIYSLLCKMKDPVFIDVGAYLGAYTLAFSKISKLVVAVEPSPINYFVLRKNLSINKVKNCIPVKCALSNYDGLSYLYISKFSDLHSLHKDMLDAAIDIIPVQTRTLDTLALRELKLNKIDLIKVDVEGAEMEVLEGMKEIIKKYGPTLIIEVFQKNLEKIEEILNKHNYNIIKRIYQSIDPLTKERYVYILAIKSA